MIKSQFRLLALATSLGLSLVSTQAQADAIDTSSIVERVCKNGANLAPKDLKLKLFGFLLADLGQDVEKEKRIKIVSDAYEKRNNLRSLNDDDKYIIDFINQLQNELAARSSEILISNDRIRPVSKETAGMLLTDAVELRCEAKDVEIADNSSEPILRLREGTDGLLLSGNDRLTAASANFGFKRERSYLEDGTRKIDTTITVKGAVGALLSDPKSDDSSSLLYAAYELNRARSKPAAILVAPATARDGDTEVLKLGFMGHSLLGLGNNKGATNVDVDVDMSYLFDFVKNAERFRASVGLAPGFGKADLGLCRIGAYNDKSMSFIPGVIGKCKIKGRFEVNHVTKPGTAEYGISDEFVLAGAEASIEMILSGNQKSGVIAGADYRYLSSIHGQVPDIDRFHAFLGYRHWFGEQWAFDIGADFVDGINPDSFADENILQLRFGVLF